MSDQPVEAQIVEDDLNISGDKSKGGLPPPDKLSELTDQKAGEERTTPATQPEAVNPNQVISERKIVPIPLPVHKTSMWDRDFSKKDRVLTCSIVDYMFDTDEKGRYAKYIFQLTYGERKWEVRHRQSEMESLVNGLRQIIPSIPPFKGVVQWFGDKYGKDIMEKKMTEYTEYFKPFIYIKALYSLSSFITFFDLARHVPFLLHNVPQYEGGTFIRAVAIRAIQPLENPDFAYLVTHDAFEMNRIEGALSNILSGNNEGKNRLVVTKPTEKAVSTIQFLVRVASPVYYDCATFFKNHGRKMSSDSGKEEVNTVLGPDTEKKPKLPEPLPQAIEPQAAVGDSNSLSGTNSDQLSQLPYFTYAPLLSTSFKATVISSHYVEPLVALGFDSGSVILLKIDASKYQIEALHTFIQAHTETVFAVEIDKERNRLISMGKDNKIVLYDISKGRSLSSVVVPGKKLYSYAYDHFSQLLFVGNGGQSVYVVDMRAEEICVVNKLTTELAGPIKSLLYLETNNLVIPFASQDGAFKALHSKDYRDPKSKVSTFLHVSQGLKETTRTFFWKERKELWTADNFGYVQVFTGIDLNRPLKKPEPQPTEPVSTTTAGESQAPVAKPKKTTAEIKMLCRRSSDCIKIPVGTRCRLR